ncbi:uncharacterized protein LOC127790584 [Diospyros lotus]|uniref:uncharacterized protein LOC127790584 n=1 Tax=Diospyros lotus TaxID=55363 RepID=UPI0022526FD7|nr:uncharacterized protein LOC127790584 [Diospyros lotus]
MADPVPDHRTSNPLPIRASTHPAAAFLLRRRKRPYVRLGGRKPRRGIWVARLFRRVRLRWLKQRLRKLKQYYRSLVRDIVEGSASMESVQQRILMETSFAIPVMGISFNSFQGSHPVI